MKLTLWTFLVITLSISAFAVFSTAKKNNVTTAFKIGQPIDSLNGVLVYYNGRVDNVSGRNLTADNYNLGLKYQCVEFVKRYYHDHQNHKMPDSYGHAKDFFDPAVKDGNKNPKRNLVQYTNPGKSKPKVDDLIIFAGNSYNQYGHVVIVSKVTENEVEIIQQNPGPLAKSRESFSLRKEGDKWEIMNEELLGWLRKE